MTPIMLERCFEGFRIQRERQDSDMWLWFGTYGLSAFSVAIANCFSDKSKAKYLEKPNMQIEKKEENGYTESKEEVGVFEMKQRINLLRASGLPESPD
nr:MAG TPA: hypothetical protein [Bacteriophage sp.]